MIKKRVQILLSTAILLCLGQGVCAQGPQGNDLGVGLVVGEPFGGTVKYWLDENQAFVGSIGGSYFKAPRVGIDYEWHFMLPDVPEVKAYVGPGIVAGLGKGTYYWSVTGKSPTSDYVNIGNIGVTGVAIRTVIGFDVLASRLPLELFIEGAPLIGVYPRFDIGFDVGLGIRFYP